MSEYLSVHKGSKVDEAVTMVREDNCKVKYGHIIGTLNDQTDLQTALDAKVDKITTINGHTLNTDINLVPNDLEAADINISNISANGIANLRGYCLSTLGGTVSGNETITGNLSVGGNMSITGTTTLSGVTTVNNSLSATSINTGSITTSGNVIINGGGNYLLLQNGDNSKARLQLPTSGNGIEVKLGDGSDYAPIKGSNITATGALNVTGATTLSGAVTVNNNINGITPTEFNCLDNVSSNIQTQIDNIKTPDGTFKATLLNLLFPIGAIYLDMKNIGRCPIQDTLGGTWELWNGDGALWEGNGWNGGDWISQGLPNHYHIGGVGTDGSGIFGDTNTKNGALAAGWGNPDWLKRGCNTSGVQGNSIYGASSRVQPQAHRVNVWKRTA